MAAIQEGARQVHPRAASTVAGLRGALLLGIVSTLSCASLAERGYAQDDALSLDEAFAQAVVFEQGESRTPLRVIRNAVWVTVDEERPRRDLEERLIALLSNDDATRLAKSFACRQLAVIGSDASVSALASLLPDLTLSHMARSALEHIPGDAAREALDRMPPTQNDSPRVTRSEDVVLWEAVRRDPRKAVDLVLEMLQDARPHQARTAARMIVHSPGGQNVTRAYVSHIQALPRDALLLLIGALRDRGDPAAAEEMVKLTGADYADLREAAIRALGPLGGPDQAPLLIDFAAKGSLIALTSLHQMHGEGTDDAISRFAAEPRDTESHRARVMAIRALGIRRACNQEPRLQKIADDKDQPTTVRVAANLALVDLTRPDEIEKRELLLRAAVYSAREWGELREVLVAMADTPTSRTLDLALNYLAAKRVQRDAARTVVAIARATGDENRAKALDAIARVRLLLTDDDDEILGAAGEAVSHIDRKVGFITEWVMAGPYIKNDVEASGLLEVEFPPETGKPVEWKPVPGDALDDPGIVNLIRALGGDNRVAYLKTIIDSGEEQPVRLEIGSDDGVRIWLNGEIVHSNNAMRGLTPGQDIVNVVLKKGDNSILMKIAQGGGDWKGCMRVRSPEGFTAEGITIRAPEN